MCGLSLRIFVVFLFYNVFLVFYDPFCYVPKFYFFDMRLMVHSAYLNSSLTTSTRYIMRSNAMRYSQLVAGSTYLTSKFASLPMMANSRSESTTTKGCRNVARPILRSSIIVSSVVVLLFMDVNVWISLLNWLSCVCICCRAGVLMTENELPGSNVIPYCTQREAGYLLLTSTLMPLKLAVSR